MAVNPENNNRQEIDLFVLFKKIGQVFDGIGYTIFKFVKFLLRNIIAVLVVLIIGGVLGFLWDKYMKSYEHEIMIATNSHSTDYLYSSIDNKKVYGPHVIKIEIEPVLDAYSFVYEKPNNLEVAKFFSDNDINFTKNKANSKVERYHRYHLMTVKTDIKDENGEIIDRILNDLNQDPYFEERLKVERENTERYIQVLDKSLIEVDNILESLSRPADQSAENIIQTYTELDKLVTSKRIMANEMSQYKIKQMEESKAIYDTSRLLNIGKNKIPKKFVFPVLLLTLYLLGSWTLINYRKYDARG